MRWRLPAKVNWTLQVLGRRADGYHELRSWFVAVDLADCLEAHSGAGSLTVSGEFAGAVPCDTTNLLFRAEQAWRGAGGVAPQLSWSLEKHIPVGAGLGGGSSDAAGALAALQALAETPLDDERCRALAAEIGSDVPFFFEGAGAELRGGRGEVCLQQAAPPRAAIVLAWPGVSVSTAKVYAALGAPPFGGAAAHASEAALPEHPGSNELEEAALRACPELRAVGAELRSIASFQLSGSGSAWFAAFPERDPAVGVAAALKDIGIWSRVVRPVSGRIVSSEVPCP